MRQKKQVTVVDVLIRMRRILKKGWVQGYYAKSKTGRIVEVDSPRAIGYCVTGARFKAERELGGSTNKARRLIESCVPGHVGVETFNDAPFTTKKDVIALVNCALTKAKAQKVIPRTDGKILTETERR